jgi:hypothetical protein
LSYIGLNNTLFIKYQKEVPSLFILYGIHYNKGMDLPKTTTSSNDQPDLPGGQISVQPVNRVLGQPGLQTVQANQTGRPVSLPAKEGEPVVSIPEGKEFPISERLAVPEIPEGVEKVEAIAGAEISLPQPVTDDTGRVVLDDAAPKQVTVTLPLTEEEMTKLLRLKLKITEATLWLAERAKMLVKKVGGRFVYRYQTETQRSKPKT